MSTAASRRRGMTFIEVTIAGLIGLTIMGVAFVFYQHTTQMGDHARQLSTASQAAAHFFYSMEQDIANLIPNNHEEDCFGIEDGDLKPGGTPGTRILEFRRMDPDKNELMTFDGNRYDQRNSDGVLIKYLAKKGEVKGFPELWELTRFQYDDANPNGKATRFSGAYAKDVRFTKVAMPTILGPPPGTDAWFLRVTLLLVGDAVNKDAKGVSQAPLVPLSALYHMSVSRFDDPDPLK